MNTTIERTAQKKGVRVASTEPRAFIQDKMGAYRPESLDELRGPAEGMLNLPKHLFWGPHASAPLTDLDHVAELYQAVIRIGTAADQTKYLNREVLLKVWPELMLPQRNKQLWLNAFPELSSL